MAECQEEVIPYCVRGLANPGAGNRADAEAHAFSVRRSTRSSNILHQNPSCDKICELSSRRASHGIPGHSGLPAASQSCCRAASLHTPPKRRMRTTRPPGSGRGPAPAVEIDRNQVGGARYLPRISVWHGSPRSLTCRALGMSRGRSFAESRNMAPTVLLGAGSVFRY